MAVTNLQAKLFKLLLQQFISDYPGIKFIESEDTYWDPHRQIIFYNHSTDKPSLDALYSVLHELGHVERQHTTYSFDIQLLLMEKEAWSTATKLGKKYGVDIDREYVEDCMDSYRDWLHKRSTCPSCKQNGIQSNELLYECLNCAQQWKVSVSRFCRSYRLAK